MRPHLGHTHTLLPAHMTDKIPGAARLSGILHQPGSQQAAILLPWPPEDLLSAVVMPLCMIFFLRCQILDHHEMCWCHQRHFLFSCHYSVFTFFFFCFSNWKIRYISFKPILCTDVGELIHLSQLASVFIKLTVVHKLQKS